MFYGCKMSLPYYEWHYLHLYSNVRRDLHSLPPPKKQKTQIWAASTLTWLRPTAITARPHHLPLIQLIFPLATVPGRLFPCYFRGTIKHCGINNGLTSSQDFFTSCLQKAWEAEWTKTFTGGAFPLSLPAESTMWTKMFAQITRYHSLHKWYCEKRDLPRPLWKLGFLFSCFSGTVWTTWLSPQQIIPLLPALWDFNEAEDSRLKKREKITF